MRPANAGIYVAFVADRERLANTSLNRFLKKLILASLIVWEFNSTQAHLCEVGDALEKL